MYIALYNIAWIVQGLLYEEVNFHAYIYHLRHIGTNQHIKFIKYSYSTEFNSSMCIIFVYVTWIVLDLSYKNVKLVFNFIINFYGLITKNVF